MKNAIMAHDIRYTQRRSSDLAYEKMQSAFGLCAFFLRHIFAVAGMLRIPLSQLQKRCIAFTLCEIRANIVGKKNIMNFLKISLIFSNLILTLYKIFDIMLIY
jgi:hypothetical protein